MSQTLAFQESLWNAAKSAAVAGQFSKALQQLQPLLSELSDSHYFAVSHRLAGRIYLAQERYQLARKMFWAVLKGNRDCSHTWHDLGVAYEKDPYGSDEKAVRCYRQALSRSPENAAIRAALGRGLVRLNRVAAGVRYLIQASPNADPSTLKVIVSGLLEADQPRRAWSVLTRLNFRLQRDPDIQKLRQEVRYALIAQGQVRQRACRRVVPFLRIAGTDRCKPLTGQILRFDRAVPPRPHVLRNRRG